VTEDSRLQAGVRLQV